ncbi:hypothetical protein ES705_45943 [subsurface metagenome]
MTAEQAKELGFVTGIITTIKAVAKYKFKNTIMNKQELEEKIEKEHNTLLEKIKNLFKVKDLTITDADGIVLDFGDQVATIEDVEVGMTATIEGGGVPDGDLVMPDGGTWVFDNGTLTEMKPPEEEETEEMKQLKAENDHLDNHGRKTSQRYSILEEIYLYKKDFTADDLYIFMRNKGYKISPANIYNTLNLFLSINIISYHAKRKGLKLIMEYSLIKNK